MINGVDIIFLIKFTTKTKEMHENMRETILVDEGNFSFHTKKMLENLSYDMRMWISHIGIPPF